MSNLENVAALVASLTSDDLSLLGRSIEDRLVEPIRAPFIPGLTRVKQSALAAGALGCSIAGSGPSVFASAANEKSEPAVGVAMRAAFTAEVLASDLYCGHVGREGARVVDPG